MILIIIGLISCRMSMFEMEDILYKLHLGWCRQCRGGGGSGGTRGRKHKKIQEMGKEK